MKTIIAGSCGIEDIAVIEATVAASGLRHRDGLQSQNRAKLLTANDCIGSHSNGVSSTRQRQEPAVLRPQEQCLHREGAR